MGLFDKIFEKKECAICGQEVGLLGNRKLEDGNMCKDCTKLLSPWFEERRHSTVEEIREQLNIREENRKMLNDFFKPSRTLGDDAKMHVMYQGSLPLCFVVAKTNNYMEENADIIAFNNVVSCTLDVRDSRTELKYTNSKNERVSYNPPRYEYRYEFYVVLGIQNMRYIDEIRFKLNSRTVKFESEGLTNTTNSIRNRNLRTGFNTNVSQVYSAEYQRYKDMYKDIETIVTLGQSNPALNIDRNKLSEEVEKARQVEQQVHEMTGSTSQGQVLYRKFCPNCGAKATGGKFCVECGEPMTVES